jgi:hypothetical protein
MTSKESEFESFSGYCKYCSDADAVREGIFVQHKIRFTQPAALNDPVDCHPLLNVPCEFGQHTRFRIDGVLMPSAQEWYHMHLIESRVNAFGILSLTKNPISFDMWSKYANGHKGFLIELKAGFNQHPTFLSPAGSRYEVLPVKYVDVFEVPLDECQDQNGELSLEKFEDRFFYTKFKRWEGEQEHRLVRPLGDLGKPSSNFHIGTYRDYSTIYTGCLPLELIGSVIFGAFMDPEIKRWIVRQCAGTNVQFGQCILFPRERDAAGLAPAINILPLDDPSKLSKILEMKPQLFLMADDKLLATKEIQLGSIDELPYKCLMPELIGPDFDQRKKRLIRGAK